MGQESDQHQMVGQFLSDNLGGNLDRVRNLLFGAQLQALNSRIDALDAKMNQGFHDMEELFKRELNALATSLQEGKEYKPFEISADDKKFNELDEAVSRLDTHIDTLNQKMDVVDRLTNELTGSINQVRQDLNQGLQEGRMQLGKLKELTQTKQDKQSLAVLFGELGDRLNSPEESSTE